MSNWDILVKVCDRLADKESKGNREVRCEYVRENDSKKYKAPLWVLLLDNSHYNKNNKVVYWIK